MTGAPILCASLRSVAGRPSVPLVQRTQTPDVSHWRRAEGKDALPQPASSTPPRAAWDEPGLLSTFFAARARCWHVFNAVSASTLRSLPAKLLSYRSAPRQCCCMCYFAVLPKVPFPLMNFRRFLLAPFPSLSRSLLNTGTPV